MIILEKETKLKETMKIMGLPLWLNWLAWFVKVMLALAISVSVVACALTIPCGSSDKAVFNNSNGFAVWLFLMCYALSVTTFCFMMSSMFSVSSISNTITGIVWLSFYFPYTLTELSVNELSVAIKIALCLFHNTAVSLGIRAILKHEANDQGLTVDSLFKGPSIEDTFAVGFAMVMMIVSAVVYLVIALYVEQIKPGYYGVPRPWYFPIAPLLNFCRDHTPKLIPGKPSSPFMEEVSEDMIVGIEMYNLRKTYESQRATLNGVTIKAYRNEITVLLGENGAGKTTLMSVLSGMIVPTSGTAVINGYDIRYDIGRVRQSIGFCPQHNILFDDLTVREHIMFFSTLKGFSKEQAQRETKKFVNKLGLDDKMDFQTKSLSGGMKRKLSVAVAFCGDSEVVLLDEPSSGMDPAARRLLWDLLQEDKKGRTILLSTHFMDEADVLGDRIAILKDGVVMSYGSPMFLKDVYNTGYILICEKSKTCDVAGVKRLIERFIPSIQINRNVGSELSFKLDGRYARAYGKILRALENASNGLGVTSFGISQTTLEEVFLM